jgi:hypothetical protein
VNLVEQARHHNEAVRAASIAVDAARAAHDPAAEAEAVAVLERAARDRAAFLRHFRAVNYSDGRGSTFWRRGD